MSCGGPKASEASGDRLFAAHSFGAIAAVRVLADTLRQSRNAEQSGLLTVGSSLLKIALHPAAKPLRADVEAIVTADRPWLDVQSLTDILNFYGTRPAELLAGRSGPNQNTTKVRFRNQLDPATYRAIKRDFFRVHRQFVFGVERRSHYAYHAILCGPEPFAEVVRRGGLLDDWSGIARTHRKRWPQVSLVVAGKIAWVALHGGLVHPALPVRAAGEAGARQRRPDEAGRPDPPDGVGDRTGGRPAHLCGDGRAGLCFVSAFRRALWLGRAVVAAAALVMFRLTHKALGKMWSVSLQLKQDHKLVTTGIYRRLRHPMYTAFWLMALAQALLLPNWIAGTAGLVGFGFLFFSASAPKSG